MNAKGLLIRNKYNILSFGIASMCMFLTLSYMGVLSTGDYSLLYGDLFMNYIPAIKNLCRDIMTGESVSFSWNICLGMNTTMYNAYYAYNPFNILYLIFDDVERITVAIIILKTGITAICFRIYVDEVHNVKDWRGVIFSIYYSMCAFQVVFNTANIIWLDAMFVLPMVFLNIHRFVANGKKSKLVFWYAYIFLFQFYMGYMIGIASVLYFTLLIIVKYKTAGTKESVRMILGYIYSIAIAIAIAAVVWIPTLYFMVDHTWFAEEAFEGLRVGVLDVFGQMIWGQIAGLYVDRPNLYCGIPTLLLAPVFFISDRVKKESKIVYGCLVAVLFLSCFLSPLYIAWHAFNYPDGWTYRFVFVICFVLCVMAAQTIDENIKPRNILVSAITFFTLCISLCLTERTSLGAKLFFVNIGITAIWMLGWYLYKRLGESERKKIFVLAILMVSAECISSYQGHEELKPAMSKTQHAFWEFTSNEAMDEFREDNQFYRIDYINAYNISYGMYSGFKGMSYFSTAELQKVRYALSLMGVHTTARIVREYGLTPITKMLFDVKYSIDGAIAKKDITEEEMHAKVSANENVLGLGYMVSGEVEDYDFADINAFENIDYLTSCMIGEKAKPFTQIKPEDMYISGNGIDLEKTDNGYVLKPALQYDDKEEKNLTFHIVRRANKPGYAYIANEMSAVESNDGEYMMQGGSENLLFDDAHVSVSYIKALEKEADEEILKIVAKGEPCEQSFSDIFFCEYNNEETEKIYEILKKNQLEIDEYSDGYIKGHISVPEDKHILFTTIPYDKGWDVTVNGSKLDAIPIFNGAFLALNLPYAGDYELEFVFKPRGINLGLIITLVGIVTFGALVMVENGQILRKIKKSDKIL